MATPAGAPRDLTVLLNTLQFADTALPIGGFSFSHGLESAVQLGVVDGVATLDQFVQTSLRQSAIGDGVALLRAHEAAEAQDVASTVAIDRLVFERKLNEEFRLMTVRMGRKLAELTVEVTGSELIRSFLGRVREGTTPGTHPVSLGMTLAALGISGRDGFAMQQYGVASTILGAALRLLRISFVDTQRILHHALAVTPSVYDGVARTAAEDMGSFAPVIDVLASAHVKGHVRMFMN